MTEQTAKGRLEKKTRRKKAAKIQSAYLKSSMASSMMFGARKPSPEEPLKQLIVIELLPLISVPAGISKL